MRLRVLGIQRDLHSNRCRKRETAFEGMFQLSISSVDETNVSSTSFRWNSVSVTPLSRRLRVHSREGGRKSCTEGKYLRLIRIARLQEAGDGKRLGGEAVLLGETLAILVNARHRYASRGHSDKRFSIFNSLSCNLVEYDDTHLVYF